MEHQTVVLHLTLDQLDYGMAHGHGQPRLHNERLLRRLAAIDVHGRLGEDRFYATRAAPVIVRRLGGLDEVDASIGCGTCSWQYRRVGCSASRFDAVAITTRIASCCHLACSSHRRRRLCRVCFFSGSWLHVVRYK